MRWLLKDLPLPPAEELPVDEFTAQRVISWFEELEYEGKHHPLFNASYDDWALKNAQLASLAKGGDDEALIELVSRDPRCLGSPLFVFRLLEWKQIILTGLRNSPAPVRTEKDPGLLIDPYLRSEKMERVRVDTRVRREQRFDRNLKSLATRLAKISGHSMNGWTSRVEVLQHYENATRLVREARKYVKLSRPDIRIRKVLKLRSNDRVGEGLLARFIQRTMQGETLARHVVAQRFGKSIGQIGKLILDAKRLSLKNSRGSALK